MRLILLFVLAALPALAEDLCPRALEAAAKAMAFFVLENTDQTLFVPGPWTSDRYQRTWSYVTRERDILVERPPTILRGLVDEYERVTGTPVTIDLQQTLPAFLAARGIAPTELQFVNEGANGAIFTHPKLGNAALKVSTKLRLYGHQFAAAKRARICLGSRENFCIPDLQRAHADLQSWLSSPVPGVNAVVSDVQGQIERAYRRLAKDTLRQTHELMVPTLLLAHTATPYIDVVRVLHLGNGFFLREFYEDGRPADVALAKALLEESGDKFDRAVGALQSASPFAASFAVQMCLEAPRYLVSPTAYRATRANARPRLFLVFDTD